jgi:hypothetical protein
VSASTASRICAELRERYRAFRQRELSRLELVALYLDAIYLPVRPSGAKEGVLCAGGIDRDGKWVLLDVCLGQRESEEDWLELGRGLTARGLRAPLPVIADGAPGLVNAIEALWPTADRRRCTVYRVRNLLAKVPDEHQQEVRARYWSALDEASGQRDGERRPREQIGWLSDHGLSSAAAWPGRRSRGALRPSALSAAPPPTVTQHQPARALTRRGAPAHQGHRTLPRRDQLPVLVLGGARPRHHPLQQHHHQ